MADIILLLFSLIVLLPSSDGLFFECECSCQINVVDCGERRELYLILQH